MTRSSLSGSKFDQKIYFEDMGIGSPAKSGGGSSSSSSPAPAKKVKGCVQGGTNNNNNNNNQPSRCQVEGCQVDLSDAKAYYSRHKVCGMHSKSPKVIVGGIEQRFCQQCSRFHLLPEFDQGKRSCRRRLAGHNERRRKPPNGSTVSSRYGRLSSSIFENGSQVTGFLMDFSAHSRLPGRDQWQTATSSERVPRHQSVVASKFDQLLQNSKRGMGFPNPGTPPGDCYMGDSDSSCALSLLSYHPWGSRNQASPGLGVSTSMGSEGGLVGQSTGPNNSSMNKVSNCTSWSFKGYEDSSVSYLMRQSDMSMSRQNSQSLTPQVSSDLEVAHLAYDSSAQQMHWAL